MSPATSSSTSRPSPSPPTPASAIAAAQVMRGHASKPAAASRSSASRKARPAACASYSREKLEMNSDPRRRSRWSGRSPYRESSRQAVCTPDGASSNTIRPFAPTIPSLPPPRPRASLRSCLERPSAVAASATYRFCTMAIEAPSSTEASPSPVSSVLPPTADDLSYTSIRTAGEALRSHQAAKAPPMPPPMIATEGVGWIGWGACDASMSSLAAANT
mmetsp:Transcript_4019/g.13022  ORF Transcript_4019/g.13022 Transcript_4019/m.13022 type:complete len:218 (+) Transcript_4019:442-1095(+)